MAFHPPIPEDKGPRPLETGMNAWIEAEKLMQVAMVLPCSALVGWLIGGYLDGRLHQHWIGLVGVIFGGISGLVYVGRLAMDHVRRSELANTANLSDKDSDER